MYQNLIKLLQNILFILLLVLAMPILILFALLSDAEDKSKTERSEPENDDYSEKASNS